MLGETGTGKELVARSIHQQSRRARQTLISVNCAAIPKRSSNRSCSATRKAPFTGANTNRMGLIEAADGGTLFLDEIGELPMEAQARLLRFIQEGEIRRIGSVQSRKVDVRLICATHRDLQTLAAEGNSARICTTASTCCASNCRRCASAARTSCFSPSASSTSRRSAWAARR
jgi:two-component system response regulator HydG